MSTTETPAAEQKPQKAIRKYFPVNNQAVLHESLLIIGNPQMLGEFRTQFSALDAQVKRILLLGQRIQLALTTAEKDALGKVREQEIRDLEAKDGLFQKVYNFRVGALAGRHTLIEPAVIRLLSPATDEEISKAREEGKLKEENLIVRGDRKLIVMSTITGEQVALFERNVNLVQAQRNNLIRLKAAADQATGEAKTKLEDQFKKDEETLIKNNEEMFKTYGFSLNRSFEVDILAGIFFVELTKEEAERAAAQQKAQGASEAPKVEAKKDKPAKA